MVAIQFSIEKAHFWGLSYQDINTTDGESLWANSRINAFFIYHRFDCKYSGHIFGLWNLFSVNSVANYVNMHATYIFKRARLLNCERMFDPPGENGAFLLLYSRCRCRDNWQYPFRPRLSVCLSRNHSGGHWPPSIIFCAGLLFTSSW